MPRCGSCASSNAVSQARIPTILATGGCDTCRYADDILLGFAGPKAEAEEIKRRLGQFLQEDLKLELSADKDADHPRQH